MESSQGLAPLAPASVAQDALKAHSMPTQARRFGHMRHQKLHLIRQDAPVAQDEVFPQAGHVGGVEQGHAGLLRGAVALAVVAGLALLRVTVRYNLERLVAFRANISL